MFTFDPGELGTNQMLASSVEGSFCGGEFHGDVCFVGLNEELIGEPCPMFILWSNSTDLHDTTGTTKNDGFSNVPCSDMGPRFIFV